MSVKDDTSETESTEEQSGGSQAGEEYLTANSRFNTDADTDGLNPRLRRDPEPEGEGRERERADPVDAGDGDLDEVAKSLSTEAEAVRKEVGSGPEPSAQEMAERAVDRMFADEEDVAKSASGTGFYDVGDVAFSDEDAEAIKRETLGVSKSTEEVLLEELETLRNLPERVQIAVKEALAEKAKAAAEADPDKSASDVLADVKDRNEEALDELDQLLMQLNDGGEETKKDAKGGGRERETVEKEEDGLPSGWDRDTFIEALRED